MTDTSSSTDSPTSPTNEDIASALREFASVGIDEVQLVVNPITEASIEWLAPIVGG